MLSGVTAIPNQGGILETDFLAWRFGILGWLVFHALRLLLTDRLRFPRRAYHVPFLICWAIAATLMSWMAGWFLEYLLGTKGLLLDLGEAVVWGFLSVPPYPPTLTPVKADWLRAWPSLGPSATKCTSLDLLCALPGAMVLRNQLRHKQPAVVDTSVGLQGLATSWKRPDGSERFVSTVWTNGRYETAVFSMPDRTLIGGRPSELVLTAQRTHVEAVVHHLRTDPTGPWSGAEVDRKSDSPDWWVLEALDRDLAAAGLPSAQDRQTELLEAVGVIPVS